jgi:hypothetical protein
LNVAEAILADRTRRAEGGRAKLARRRYGEVTGLTEQRIWALEHGRKLKPGELTQLRPFIGDLLEDGDTVESAEIIPKVNVPDETVIRREREGLQAAYEYVQQRLGGKPAPYAWPGTDGLDACSPSNFEAIRAWIQAVHEYLDGVRGESETPGSPDPDPDDPDPPVELLPPGMLKGGEEDEDERWDEVAYAEAVPVPGAGIEFAKLYPAGTVTHDSRVGPQITSAVEPLDPQYRYVTNGELRTWSRCRRQWWFGYHRQLGLRAVQVVGAASVGTRVHRVLAEYYVPEGVRRRDPWEVFEETLVEDRQILDEQEATEEKRERWRKEVDLARAMLEGYFEWVEETAADAGMVVTAPETRLIANPRFDEFPDVRLLAKLDVRAVRTLDNSRVFWDHKTRADLVPKTLHLDEQMLHYMLVEYLDLLDSDQAESRTDGAIYNMLRKVKRTATARPPFYARVEVRHNLDELRSYWQRVREKVTEIERARERLEAGEDHRSVCYPMPTGECSWQCDYFQLCPMYDDGSRAEDFVKMAYVEVNPLRRYEPDQVGVVG